MRAAILASAIVLLAPAEAQRFALGEPRILAPGLLLFQLDSATILDADARVSIRLLRLDPAQLELKAVLANDEVMGTETVAGIAERHQAIAAVNAGFFAPNGDPSGVLTIDGRMVSDTRRPRGAVGILNGGSRQTLLFARLRATQTLLVYADRSKAMRVPIDGIDTTRIRGQLMLFTPLYHADTDTVEGGLEWVVDAQPGERGQPLRVVSGPHRTGRTQIPPGGFVLSFGATKPSPELARLKRRVRIALESSYEPIDGEPESWSRAQYIVGGAGLLIKEGRDVDDWSVETFAKGFAENRHPRTMIGSAEDGTIWLVTVDGRQPEHSAGMTLVELRDFARRLGLANALNLDGGGSTTMWVQGQVINRPSDATGPRKVSDALIVSVRESGGGREGRSASQ
jgi:exopolysaccharide biosynthesis protein